MIYATYITYISSEKEETLGLPQLGVRFLADVVVIVYHNPDSNS